MILIGSDDFQVIRPEVVGVDFLDAVDKLDGSGVSILGKEGDRGFPCLDGLEDVADGLVDKECILNFVLVFFGFLLVKAFGDLGVVGCIGSVALLLVVVLVVLVIAFLVLLLVAANLRNGEWLIEGRLHVFGLLRVAEGQVVVIEL